ncbi:MAG: hypothetical protein JSU63_06045 [Phycisphaerales bacterium]|nr:MAG: hypothetical protein JSU63_06045 [Phycisphaerales bacterium]
MTDESVPDPPSPEPAGTDGEDPYEDELDALLAAATTLATEMSDEIGAPEEPTQASSSDPEDDSPKDVEAQLGNLEGFLDQTSREIGTTPDKSDEDGISMDAGEPPGTVLPAVEKVEGDEVAPASEGDAVDAVEEDQAAPQMAETDDADETMQPTGEDANAATTTSPEIPDFMDEFTRPEGEAAPDPEESTEPAETAPAVPDFMSEFTEPEGDAGGSPNAEEQPAGQTSGADVPDFMAEFTDSAAATDSKASSVENGPAPAAHVQNTAAENESFVGADDDETGAESGSGTGGFTSRLPRQVVARLEPLGLLACEGGVRALEAIDKPTQRVGNVARRIIGWVAIATLGTSVIVYICSLF